VAWTWNQAGTTSPYRSRSNLGGTANWNVVKQQLYVGDKHRPLPGQFAIVREDRWERNEDAIFGTVGQTYVPLQNMQAFTFFDPIIETGSASYESAGGSGQRRTSLGDGAAAR